MRDHPPTPDLATPSVCICGVPMWATARNARHQVDEQRTAEAQAVHRQRAGDRDDVDQLALV